MESVDKNLTYAIADEAGLENQQVIILDSAATIKLTGLICNQNPSVQPMQLHILTGDSLVASYFNKGSTSNYFKLKFIK